MTDYIGEKILAAAYLDRRSKTIVVKLDDIAKAFKEAERLGFIKVKGNRYVYKSGTALS